MSESSGYWCEDHYCGSTGKAFDGQGGVGVLLGRASLVRVGEGLLFSMMEGSGRNIRRHGGKPVSFEIDASNSLLTQTARNT